WEPGDHLLNLARSQVLFNNAADEVAGGGVGIHRHILSSSFPLIHSNIITPAVKLFHPPQVGPPGHRCTDRRWRYPCGRLPPSPLRGRRRGGNQRQRHRRPLLYPQAPQPEQAQSPTPPPPPTDSPGRPGRAPPGGKSGGVHGPPPPVPWPR